MYSVIEGHRTIYRILSLKARKNLGEHDFVRNPDGRPTLFDLTRKEALELGNFAGGNKGIDYPSLSGVKLGLSRLRKCDYDNEYDTAVIVSFVLCDPIIHE